MLRLTLAQMRRSLGRLAAAGIAITLGTGFVTATLLAGAALTRTTYDAVTSGYADADLVVSRGEITAQSVTALEGVPGVRALHGHVEVGAELVGPSGQTYLSLTTAPDDPDLRTATLLSGRFPQTADEIALPVDDATVVGVEAGDSVQVATQVWSAADQEAPVVVAAELRVVGLLDRPEAAYLSTGSGAVVHPTRLDLSVGDDRDLLNPWTVLIAVDDGTSVRDVQSTAQEVLQGAAEVLTVDEAARQIIEEVSGDADQVVLIVLGFAAVALVVAALVISNTFQVLVAQRTRTLALLRCVGADRAQLRRSVVLEALLVGSVASAAGLLLGIAVVQGALLALTGTQTDVPLPDRVTITPAAALLPLAVGTVVTVLAALAPALAATRVPPLAALRPVENPTLGRGSGRARGWTSAVLTLAGLAGLAGGLAGSRVDLAIGLAVGVLGGTLSFVGVILGSVFWVPRVVGRAGDLVGRWGGPAARLAAANSVRNPRRTAATSTALFIGVTLVAMMSTGAASARVSLTAELADAYPVDVAVGTMGDGVTVPALPAGLAAEVDQVTGVETVVTLRGTVVEIVEGVPDGTGAFLDLRSLDPDEDSVLNRSGLVAGLQDGSVLVPETVASWTGLQDGATITVQRQTRPDSWAWSAQSGTTSADEEPAAGESAEPPVELVVVVTELPSSAMLVTPGTLGQVDGAAPVTRLWVKLSSLARSEQAVAEVRQVASDSGVALETVGAAVERAFYQRVVNTLLLVVLGLLAVAVVIAVVGVTNTLSLSVLERRRESATLRALGLSRRRLRATLAIEGMLIAGVGAVGGIGLGTLYGWAGARTVLSSRVDSVELVVPWTDLGVVLVVAVLAGLLASALPGRTAARTSPVAALAVE